MNAITVTAEINGQQVDIKDCAWYFVAPCGCTHGVMTSRDYANNSWITSPEQAHAEMTPNRAVREQDIAAGEKVELGLHTECSDRLRAKCTHTPPWGAQPIPAGTAWAKADRGRSAHLVDELQPEEGDYWRGQFREPKCGAKRDLFEIHPSALSDAPMCKKCLTDAKEAAA